jgi:hypothetical protein
MGAESLAKRLCGHANQGCDNINNFRQAIPAFPPFKKKSPLHPLLS